MILIENENINRTLNPSFSPDDKHVIYATKNEKKFQIYRIEANENPGNNDLIQEFDENSKLILFRYTIDGKFIVALFSKNKKFIFRFIELNDNEELKPFKDIEIDPKNFCKDFDDDFFNSSFILNFSISNDNSKIVFLFQSPSLRSLNNNLKEIFIINRNDTEICIPKKIYETKKELNELNSLDWLPNDEEII